MFLAKIIKEGPLAFIFDPQDTQTIVVNRDEIFKLDQHRKPVFKDSLGASIVSWPTYNIYRGLRLHFEDIEVLAKNGFPVANSYFSKLPIIAGLNALLSSRNAIQSQGFCAVVFEVDTRKLPAEYTNSHDSQDPNLIVTAAVPVRAITRIFVYSLYERRFIQY